VKHCVTNDRGFTLIEALVAIVLLGIVLASLFAMFSTGIRIQHMAELNGTASDLASDGIETMRARLNANDLASIAEPHTNPETVEPGFERTIEVDQTGSTPNRMWTITSTVTYTVGGAEKSVSYTTVLAEP
jgi:prepilin-type N-terminal cleavage/methylation domain-containing protein